MTILVDSIHLVATDSERELHDFAQKRLGLPRWAYHGGPLQPYPYYACTGKTTLQAINNGAKLVGTRTLLRQAWWAKGNNKGEEAWINLKRLRVLSPPPKPT